MSIGPRQQMSVGLQQRQTLTMTPQLQMAIKLLQLNRLELAEHIQEQLLENPMLEQMEERPLPEDAVEAPAVVDVPETPGKELTGQEGEGVGEFDWDSYLESYNLERSHPNVSSDGMDDETREFIQSSISRPETLSEHLLWQIKMGDFDEKERLIAAYCIENLDERGYLAETTSVDGSRLESRPITSEEIAEATGAVAAEVESVIGKLRLLDPPGICSRSLRECMLAQLEVLGFDGSLSWEIVDKHLDLVDGRNVKPLARRLKETPEKIIEALNYLKTLEPEPARSWQDTSDNQYIVPDVYIEKDPAGGYRIVLNDDDLPAIRVSPHYLKLLRNQAGSGSKATRDYVRDKLRNAEWLIKSVHQRKRTIYRVVESIVKFQREFLDHGITHLKPLILRDVAEDIGMHESTVSRVTSNKYVHTPRGIFELKYFFNSGISTTYGGSVASESVKERLKKMVGEETGEPLTDMEIVNRLKEEGISISRRALTKYREQLGIPSSSKRRKFY